MEEVKGRAKVVEEDAALSGLLASSLPPVHRWLLILSLRYRRMNASMFHA